MRLAAKAAVRSGRVSSNVRHQIPPACCSRAVGEEKEPTLMAKTNQEYAEMAKTPAECDNLIVNAAKAGNTELALLARKRKIVLQAALHGALSQVEVEAWNGIYAIEEYRRSQGKQHWRATYTRRAIDNRNGNIVATVDDTVCRAAPSDGFQEMIDAGLEEFLWERLVLRYPEHFSARAAEQARARLGV